MRESSSNALTAAFCFLTKKKKIRNERERERERERDCSNALTTAFGLKKRCDHDRSDDQLLGTTSRNEPIAAASS